MFIPVSDAPNESDRIPWVNHAIIVLNVAIYVWALFTHRGAAGYGQWVEQWGYVPLVPRLETLFTHMFMHAGFLHLAGNMVFLWVFGDNVERRLGHAGYAFFYLACGLAAVLLFHVLSPDSTIPLVGASGAIFGVEGFYFLAFPQNRVRVLLWVLLIFTFWVPARVVLGLSFLTNLIATFQTYGSTGGGGVAYAAHVGGFLAGLGLAAVLRFTGPGREGRAPHAGAGGAAARALARAQILLSTDRYAEAEPALEAVIADHLHAGEAAEAALLLGLLRSRVLGRPEGARRPLEFAARMHPDPRGRATAAAELGRLV